MNNKTKFLLVLCICLFTASQAYSSDTCNNCSSLNSSDNKAMKQVYAYPEAIYGTNNMIGETNNNVTVSDGSNFSVVSKGVPLAEVSSSQVTGAAANIPTWATYDFQKFNNTNFSEPEINIHTQSSQQIVRRGFKTIPSQGLTGAAAPLKSYFPDVNSNYWASEQINRLARENVAQGYPSGLFKPNDTISRAEMASLLLHGMNMESSLSSSNEAEFKDVQKNYWAFDIINAVQDNNIMNGYDDDTFKPEAPVTKVEAMSMLSKKIDSDMSAEKADKILSNYKNGDKVPDWAKQDVAKVIEAHALKDMKNPSEIFIGNNATRAEVASMLDNIRISLGYSEADVPFTKAEIEHSYVPTEEIVTVPTLKLVFHDMVSAKSATVGDIFAAKTLEMVTIDGINFEAGSIVRGRVSEVVRPSKGDNGAIKLSFETIENKEHKAKLPTQILTAQVHQFTQPNLGVRAVQMPMTMLGGIIGTAGRTIGGAAISISNAAEQTLNGIGIAGGEVAGGNFRASGRSLQDVGKAIVKSPIDLTRTTISGTVGILKTMGEEVAYVIDVDGNKISTIRPKEKMTISFGCYR